MNTVVVQVSIAMETMATRTTNHPFECQYVHKKTNRFLVHMLIIPWDIVVIECIYYFVGGKLIKRVCFAIKKLYLTGSMKCLENTYFTGRLYSRSIIFDNGS